MTVVSVAATRLGGAGRGVAPIVRETYWGYEIPEKADQDEHETALESILRFLGLVFVLAAYGQWLLPSSLFGYDANVARASLTFVLGAGGAAIYWFANRGLLNVLEVDVARRELRQVCRNAREQSRLRRRIPMDMVSSAFLHRSGENRGQAELWMRLADGREFLVAHGAENDLMSLHKRLSLDLRPIQARIDERLAERPLFVSSRRKRP